MHPITDILLLLFVMYVAALLGGELALCLRLPAVVGEIVAGCVLGPSVLGWIGSASIASGTPVDMLAEVGVILLLFSVGLETSLADLKAVGGHALAVGVLGVITPFVMASTWAHGLGLAWAHSMFVAAAFVATSAGITARVLQELGVLGRREARIILGAAVIDDILAMLLLGIVTAMQGHGEVSLWPLLGTFAGAVGFVAVIGLGGSMMMRRGSGWLDAPQNPLSPLAITLAMCLGLAWLSTRFHLAAIIGAFLAGMVAAETRQRGELARSTSPLLAFLTPFFFVVTGARVDLGNLADAHGLAMLAMALAIAIVSKVVGGFLGAISLGKTSALIVGVGMVPRGEVGVVIASLGLATGLLDSTLYSVIVGMSILSSIATPPALAWMFRSQRASAEQPATSP
ncbi:cation:proton antiporter [Pinirhizobacter sp.]|jgi:Kef-type K+ transport system membrane component KefB|uniref:cation:proton antiporter n=1 Tax=Pinirhizobacter sp. TaxID=2950432 RepID=UPI002F3FDC54